MARIRPLSRKALVLIVVSTLALVTVGIVIERATRDADPPLADQDVRYLDPSYSPAERAADLVARMTLDEKASQMISSVAPAIPRLGVREYAWWNEAIHGVARQGYAPGNPTELVNTTMYPASLSLGSTWNPELVYRIATQISDEAREVTVDNTRNLNYYSPTINLSRDPRWGRNDETYSEDPYLTASIAAQYVNGMEGKDSSGRELPEGGGYLKTATTLKHYAANNSEFDRLTGSSDVDERTLREYYTAQFRAVVRSADPASIMTAYNRVNGVPASASVHLLQTLGRQTFGFDGFYTSDCDAIYEIQFGHRWQPPERTSPVDEIERHAFASAAGLDLNCQAGYHDRFNYANTLPTAVERGIVTELGTYAEAALDASLVRLFTVRFQLGEFDDPASVPWVTAARARVPAGTWHNNDGNGAVTMTPQRLALARQAAAESIVLLRNEPVQGRALLPLRVPATGDYRVAVVGPAAAPSSMYLGGYSSRQGDAGIAKQVNGFEGIATAVRAVNPAATVEHLPGLADLTSSQIDAATLQAVGSYDVVIVYAGTDARAADEAADRGDLALPGAQAELIAQVAARNPNTVVYLETIGQVDVGDFIEDVPALLWSSYNGQRKGEGLADVLLGAADPGGRLPFTWYADAVPLPALDDYAIRPGPGNPGRTYQYFTGEVAFPFGHGGSYTSVTYSPARVDASAVDADATVTVSVDVTNTGTVAGSHVVQLYAATPQSPQRPAQRLVGFQKLTLQPGQTTTVTLPVAVADLAFFDETLGRFVVDPGIYTFRLGASSTDIRATAQVEVSGSLTPVPVALTAAPVADGDEAIGPSRVIYAPGSRVLPRLTVAMSDDTLYGHGDTSGPLPGVLTVSYESNRADVVTVDADGIITAVGAGVATVTVTVTVSQGDVSLRRDFVVLVR